MIFAKINKQEMRVSENKQAGAAALRAILAGGLLAGCAALPINPD
jgi:hypothetical protein